MNHQGESNAESESIERLLPKVDLIRAMKME